MPDKINFSDEEIDVLREIANIGMGKAGSALAEAFGCFVLLKVPEIKLIDSSTLRDLSFALVKDYEIVNIVRQSFSGNLNGESISILGKTAYSIKDLLGYTDSETLDQQKQKELLLDISNSLTSACLASISQQLSLDTSLSPPNIVCFEQPGNVFYKLLFGNNQPTWNQSLFAKVELNIKDREFSSDLLIFVSQLSLTNIKKSVKSLLEN